MRRLLLAACVAAGCQTAGSPAEDTDTDPGTTAPVTTSSTTSTSTTGARFEQTLACESWLACLDDNDRESLVEEYGADGSCWRGNASLVEECDAVCVDGFREDCRDPSEDTTTPDLPPDVEECSLEALAPAATSWVVAGEDEGVLPAEIGTILEQYCSCHATELDQFPPLTPLYEGDIRFVTHEDFHANFEGNPSYVLVKERTIDTLSMPPLYFCGDGDFGSSVHSPDFEIFDAWLSADAPDAPTWVEIRPKDLP